MRCAHFIRYATCGAIYSVAKLLRNFAKNKFVHWCLTALRSLVRSIFFFRLQRKKKKIELKGLEEAVAEPVRAVF